jgi:hypothetical protein
MKNAMLLLFALFSTLSIAQVPQNGLLFYFPFNGDMNDAGPNANYGNLITTATGSVVLASDKKYNPTSSCNFTGGYLDFGMNDKMVVGDSSFTFSAWVCATSGNSVNTIFSNNFGFSGGLSIGMKSGNFYAAVCGGTMPNSISVNVVYDENDKWYTWQHIAVVLNRSTKKFCIYVNGVKRTIANDTSYGPYGGSISGNELDFTGLPLNLNSVNTNALGAYIANGRVYQAFLGYMDDVALYNRALSETEITGIYSGTTALHEHTFSPTRKIFLNPTDETVIVNGLDKNAELTVYNMSGVKLATIMAQSIDVSTLPKGIYFLKVDDGSTIFSEKFNKQ